MGVVLIVEKKKEIFLFTSIILLPFLWVEGIDSDIEKSL